MTKYKHEMGEFVLHILLFWVREKHGQQLQLSYIHQYYDGRVK